MNKDDRIMIAGGRGMVGQAVMAALTRHGYSNVLGVGRQQVDLTDQAAVNAFFESERPDHVVLAAARVGGILANMTYPAEFIGENLKIQTNVIDAAWRNGVKRLLFMSSSCVYPRECVQPMPESALLSGPPEPTNAPYAMAKLAGMAMCEAYRAQYGCEYFSVLPSNLYGYNDDFHPDHSHVLAALMRKMITAHDQGHDSVTLWGTGAARREFLFVDDLAEACVFLLEQNAIADVVNIGSGDEVSIADLARLIADEVGFAGELAFDTSKPDGVPRKLLDSQRLNDLGWTRPTALREGIRATLDWYRQLPVEQRV